jgi:diguanylate cyclase (GGDEF)-like protein
MEKVRSKHEKEKTMTLFKQMALAISFIIILVLASVIYINYQSAKNDMIEALYENSVNNISSLQNRLAQTQGEKAAVISTIDSEFDSGYYRSISYRSADGSFSYRQQDNDPVEGVPSWFINFTNIHIEPITADVNAGWTLLGKLSITADPSSIYKGLYKNFIQLLYLFIFTVLLSLLIVAILLHFILKPLKRIQNQAEAIVNNEFVIEKEEPYTTEFRDVSHAMNAMVRKVEEIFNKANEAAKRNKELLYNDPVTKLFNRRYLSVKLPEMLTMETKIDGGSILLIAISGAEEINAKLGRQEGDNFFFTFAKMLQELTKECHQRLLARVNGTEFILVLPDCESFVAQHIARELFESFEELTQAKGLQKESVSINIGIYRYRSDCSPSEALTKADDALTKAKADKRQHIYIYEQKSTRPALAKETWRKILTKAIESGSIELKFWPTIDIQQKKVDHHVMTFTLKESEQKELAYGDFIAPAITLGFVSDIYLVSLRKLFTYKNLTLKGAFISVRLSNEFLKDTHASKALEQLFAKYAKSFRTQLCFEVSDDFAIANTATLRGYVTLFRKYHFRFGINGFTGAYGDYKYLKELNPEFIKADVTFLLDQTKESMHSLDVITKSLGIEIIATSVKNYQEIASLQELHIEKVQGLITEKLDFYDII